MIKSVPRYQDDSGYKNLNFGLSAGGKATVKGAHSLIFEYDQLLTKQDLDEQPKPNLATGWEDTDPPTLSKSLWLTSDQIINQRNLVFNANNFADKEFLVGFNITVRF